MSIINKYGFQVQREHYPEKSEFKFGYNPEVGTDPETIWDGGGLYSYPTSASIMKVSSSNNLDTSTTLTIYGLNENYDAVSESITLNGQTAVNTTNQYIRSLRVIVNTNEPQGDIYVGTGTVTVGNGTLTVQGTGALGGSGTFTANQSGNATISISHDDTSSQASVNNSGRTYIQDITLDTYGHITGISSATETVTNTNTTYSAGTGLDLSGTTFSVESDQRGEIALFGYSSTDYINSTATYFDFVLEMCYIYMTCHKEDHMLYIAY